MREIVNPLFVNQVVKEKLESEGVHPAITSEKAARRQEIFLQDVSSNLHDERKLPFTEKVKDLLGNLTKFLPNARAT